MKTKAALFASAVFLTLSLSACSPAADAPKADAPAAEQAPAAPAPAPTPTPAPVNPKVIGLEGLGDLRIGEAPPTTGTWASRGAQESDACTTVTSPDYPGVYALVTDGKVQRITVGQRSDVKLVEGVGVGSTEDDVRKWFAGFRAETHKYEDSPAKYLTAPNARPGESALRFEIGQDSKVKLIHIGMMPVLAYVEGCG